MYGILGTVTNLHVMSMITKPFVIGMITNLSLRAQLQTSVVKTITDLLLRVVLC